MLVLRILNGPLFGTEVVVPSEGCFVRVVDLSSHTTDLAIEKGIDLWAKGTVLTIPLAGAATNFRLIPNIDEQGDVTLKVETYAADSGSSETVAALNKTLSIGGLQIAIRRASDVWSDDVLLNRAGQALPGTAITLAVPVLSARQKWHRLATVCSALAGAAGLATLVGLTWPAPAPAANVKSLLGEHSSQVVEGDDRRIYIFVQNAESVASVRRQLARAGVGNVRVRVRSQEAARIGRWLESSGVPYFSVDLTDFRRPVLRLRLAGGANHSMPDDFDARLRMIAPYARDVKVNWHNEEEAQRAARFLVDGVGARATYRTTPGHFVAAVDDHLSDAQLDAFSRSLNAYRRTWGKDYTQFEINQRDLTNIDGLKTGQFNYELRSARHIYFPPT